MTVREYELIDGFLQTEKNVLGLIINDALSWDDDTIDDHMYHLKSKFDYYVNYIKNKRYESILPNKNFDKFIIEFRSQNELSEEAYNYIHNLENKLKSYNLEITTKIMDIGNYCG